jgi:hypothetical protein
MSCACSAPTNIELFVRAIKHTNNYLPTRLRWAPSCFSVARGEKGWSLLEERLWGARRLADPVASKRHGGIWGIIAFALRRVAEPTKPRAKHTGAPARR